MKMKKVLAICLSMAMLLGLAGCGGSNSGGTNTDGAAPESSAAESAPAQEEDAGKTEEASEAPAQTEDVTLTMWTFPFGTDEQGAEERANYETMAAEFEAATGIHVDVEIIPWGNRETKMLTAIASGEGPDVMYLNPDILKQFQAYGVVSPITDYVSAETLAGYSESLLDNSVRIQGELYGLPVLVDLGRPVYNLDLLAEIGMTEDNLPTTWEEYDAMLAALKEKGIYGVYCNYPSGGVSSYAFAQFFSEGCDVVKEDGTVDIDSEAGKKVLGRLASWYQNGYTPTDSLSIADDDASFMSGKVASTLSSKGAGFFVRMAPDITFNWAAGPILSGEGGQYGISTVGSLGVSKSCENVEAAVKWIEFFTEVDRLQEWCNFGGYICAKEGGESPYQDLKGYAYLLENMDCVRGEPNHAAARTMSSVFTPDLQAIVSGDVSLDEGIAKMKADIEGIVSTVDALRN